MDAGIKETKEQALKEMELFKTVFDGARLLDMHALQLIGKGLGSYSLTESEQKFDFWEKEHPCNNDSCIVLQALRDKDVHTKLEFIGSQLYEVTARYMEVEGEPYVLELVKRMDDNYMIDENQREKLLRHFGGYHEQLYKDALTGAYNRRYFEEKIRKSTVSAGVAMIDLDDFKLYNDSFGHDTGDVVLITFVNIIKNCTRKTDMLIRYGGDEFLLIMPGIKEENFKNKLLQILEEVHRADVPGHGGLRLSASIGGVLSNGSVIEDAIGRADKLMYQAKNRKNMVVTEDNLVANDIKKGMLCDREKIRQLILIVDDSELNRTLLSEMLKDDFRILEASNGRECLDALEQYGMGISLVLLDINMPVMDGFEVLVQMNRNHWIEDIPVVMISSDDTESNIKRAYDMGVSDYIRRPFDAQVVFRRVFNTIKLYAKQRRLITLVTDQIDEKEKNNQIMIRILSQIVEFRNGESGLHVEHINILTGLLLERLVQKTDHYDLTWSDQYMITLASALHDIGKIGIDDKILNKPGRLTKEEFEIMKSHTLIGASILENLGLYQEEPLIKTAYQICRWHHERYDGKGYPDGLRGDEIPISAQVVSVADVYDALVNERVYKKAITHEKAIEMILNGECGVFNPILLECLVDIKDKIY
ncbi:diguanylate cyclase [Coprococcus catus]|uniref:Stage 0 sporulation protein A homolog n=2 Tax=Coprococcus catus TaxID=116085 RepID=A0A3E2TSS4_9FIRM|nr:diguanylate cyclase [Coprococcus catus]RGB81990.1 diguanylate cyclase [Coprococcus catus]CBK79264.1 diguanylate cyclase (GGDEF) domain [Coprococcus catus GD/7]